MKFMFLRIKTDKATIQATQHNLCKKKVNFTHKTPAFTDNRNGWPEMMIRQFKMKS